MARTVKQLTVTQINNAKSREKVYYLSDGQGVRLAIVSRIFSEKS
ncbi:hypothetical protein [Gallibacterium sp. ZY190522]